MLFHDRDTKFTKAVDADLAKSGVKVRKTAFRAPNTNAFVERFIQTIQQECLDHFVIFGTRHFDHLASEWLEHYHEERPHQAKENEVLVMPKGARKKPAKRRDRDKLILQGMNDRSDGSGIGTGLVIAIVALVLALPCCGGLALVGAAFFGFKVLERPWQPQPVIQAAPAQPPPVAVPPAQPEPPPVACRATAGARKRRSRRAQRLSSGARVWLLAAASPPVLPLLELESSAGWVSLT
jgi:hypothetical protein